MAQKVLVTGSEGFIGSHLTEALVKAGFSVRAFVMYNSFGKRGWLESCPPEITSSLEFVSGDVRDAYGVRSAMEGVDIVFHLAALIAIPYSYQSPSTYVDTNVHGTLNVLQAARELGVSKVLHTSTSEVYGSAQYVPIDENHRLQGQSPYSASKIAADQMAFAFHRSFNTPVSVVRPFNTYGPRQSARAIIPTIITQIASGKRKLKLGSLTPTRDFSFVADTVRGFLAVAASDAAIGEVVNIGSDFEISVGDLARTIASEMGVEVSVATDEQRMRPRESEVTRLRADTSKAKRLLGWAPEYGGLEGLRAGLRATVRWYEDASNLSGYRPDEYAL